MAQAGSTICLVGGILLVVGVVVVQADGFEELFAAEYAPVVRTVYLICQDLPWAQDVTQEAFLQLLLHWRHVSRFDRPGAWVRRVAIRMTRRAMSRDLLRRRAEAAAASMWEPGSPDVDVMNAIGSLSHHQRVAVVLFYYERASLEEIANVLGCAPSTAGVHLHRARARLGSLLAEVGSDEPR
jgi:DNA-directed RNA polymerase specialized sigma24 family protein